MKEQQGWGETTPDIVFVIKTETGASGLVLTLGKLVEDSFYSCIARTLVGDGSRIANPDPDRCLKLVDVLQNPIGQCHQYTWKRRYWDHLWPVANQHAMLKLCSCPAATAGYQLFRLQAAAEGVANGERDELAIASVAYDDRNTRLIACLAETGIPNFTVGWGPLFKGKAQFATFTHQHWVSWVRANAPQSRWQNWLTYIWDRYGY